MTAQEAPVWLTILRRRGPMLFNNFVVFGQYPEYFREMLGFDFGIRSFKYVDGEISIDIVEVGKLGALVGQRVEKSPDFLREFLDRCGQQCNRLLNISRQISNLDNSSLLTNDELEEWFGKYVEEVLKMMPFLNIFAIMERMFQERISEELGKNLAEKGKSELLDLYLKDLIFPTEDNYVVKEIDDLIKIAAMIQKNHELTDLFQGSIVDIQTELPLRDASLYSRLQEHAERFGFLNMYTYEGSPMTVGDVIARLKALLKRDCEKRSKDIAEQKRQAQQRYEEIVQELQIDGLLLQLIEYAREYLYFRLYRLDVLFMAGCYVRGFMEEIGRRMGIGYDDVINLWHKEIMLFLEEGIKVDISEIKKRKEGYATILIDGELEILSGKEELACLVEEEPEEIEKYQAIQEFEGTVAAVGRHVGAAKLVTSADDIGKVQEADILVSTMTNPYYVPAMIRAGAIVTDEGGILSHAAIVSRELGVPCVIGTNIATKVLRDNDVVEVDATRATGIVRIVRRA